jgi:hypothetical protein
MSKLNVAEIVGSKRGKSINRTFATAVMHLAGKTEMGATAMTGAAPPPQASSPQR